MQDNINKMLNCLKKTLDIEKFGDYNESLFESRMEDITHIMGFVKEIKEYDDEMQVLEERINTTYKTTNIYFEYLTRYEDSINIGEYEYHELLYKYGISDAIKIIIDGKVKNNLPPNLLLQNVINEEFDNILNHRIDYIVQNIVNKDEKKKSLEWEESVDDNIRNEEIIVEYKKVLNKEITMNRQLAYKYGLYDGLYVFNEVKNGNLVKQY